MSFKWTSKYAIGNEDIESEHKHLFVLAEKLLIIINQSPGNPSEPSFLN